MPILDREVDLYPGDLLGREDLGQEEEGRWWALYTRAHREKDLMRRLLVREIPFYGPVVARTYRSPAGRLRTSYLPLFPNYVFIYDDGSRRRDALHTNGIVRYLEVPDSEELTREFRRVQWLIATGVALKTDERWATGTIVRVKSGRLEGCEGVVIERESQQHLVVGISFLGIAVSVGLEESDVESL